MDAHGIDQKIRFGYAKAAQKLGQPFDLYRSTTPFTPIQDDNLIGTLPMVASQDWTWMKANKPGNSTWFVCVDGRESSEPLSATEGDYLIGDRTFFILSKEYQLPMQAIECNKLINIIRPFQANTAGYNNQYASYQPGNSTLIMEHMPVSFLMYRQGGKADSKLPTDTSEPTWIVNLPNLGEVNIRTGDIIQGDSAFVSPIALPGTLEDNERFVVNVTEETEFGWRLTCTQVMN